MSTNPEEDFQKDAAHIESFRFAKEGSGLERVAEEIHKKWSERDIERYSALMLDVCQTFNTLNVAGDKAAELSQKYARLALLNASTMPVETETKLVLCLTLDLEYSRGKLESQEWLKLRSEKAKLWLDNWQRLQGEFKKDFDFTHPPFINVPPPEGANIVAGMSPDAIQDPELRAKYELAIKENAQKAEIFRQQRKIQSLFETFADQAERYLIESYSKPPYATEELKKNLQLYGVDKERQTRILQGVDDAIKRKAQEAADAKQLEISLDPLRNAEDK